MNQEIEANLGKPPRVTFYGAAQAVSGSVHLIEFGDYRFLLDCGLFRGPRDEAKSRNSRFAFDPTTIDAVFLSHAHVDHCGNLPNLVRQGFAGPIYCTNPTLDLITVMLEDSARIHEQELAMAYNRNARNMQSALFGYEDVENTIDLCVGVDYEENIDVNPDVQIRFIDSGHILGSAMIVIKMMQNDREYTITFTGDLGRRGVPFVAEPTPVPSADLIICESTYGGKTHDSLEVMADKMSGLVTKTYERGGKILIPAFSLGRTHMVIYYLRLWMRQGLMPKMPVYVDSPLAQKFDAVFQKHQNCLAPDFDDDPCEWLESEDDAWCRSTQREPCIIVASGGMCEGGRIVPHLKNHIDDPRATIVLVSYQAPDTMGAQLLSHVPTVRLHGRIWNKWIEVAEVKGFSGHADQHDFEALLRDAVDETGKVRLVHGEPPQMLALASQLRDIGFKDVEAPKRMESVVLR